MSDGYEAGRLTPEQRRSIEDAEARREAEYAAELARQRALLQHGDQDSYVARRMEKEMQAIAAAQQEAEAEEQAQSGGSLPNPYLLLVLGALLSALLLGLASR